MATEAVRNSHVNPQKELERVKNLFKDVASAVSASNSQSSVSKQAPRPAPRLKTVAKYASYFAVLDGRPGTGGMPGSTSPVEIPLIEDQENWRNATWANFWLELGEYKTAEQVAVRAKCSMQCTVLCTIRCWTTVLKITEAAVYCNSSRV